MRDVFPGEEASGEAHGNLGWAGNGQGDRDRPPSLWDDDRDECPVAIPERAKGRKPRRSGVQVWAIGLVAGVAALLAAGLWYVSAASEPEREPAQRERQPTHTTPSATPSSPTVTSTLSQRPISPQVTTEVVTLPRAWSRRDWDPLATLKGLVSADATVRNSPPYDREAFGQAWLDLDRNGCDTRNDTLRRDLAELQVMDNTQGCVAYSGILTDPYTGTSFAFLRGSGNAGELHVDHVVALSDAWRKGAHAWTLERRAEFANDPDNLVVTLGAVNMGKGDQDAGSWLPPRSEMHCAFALQVVALKSEYALGVDGVERDSLRQALLTCSEDSSLLIRSDPAE